jgi:LysM repeat protein
MRKTILIGVLALALAAAFAVAVPTGQASANGGHVHCVRYGETLYGIASWYGTSAQAIAHYNGLWNPNYIRAGQCLRIPSGYGYGHGTNWGYTNPHYGANYGAHYGAHYGYDSNKHAGYYGKPGMGHGRVHCVSHGETLSGIAWRYGSSTWAIANANGLWSPNYIRAGQCLVIP